MTQIILHVDMDAFFAAVEMRDDPTLRGKPLIIGSLLQERGVVSTCNYEARKYGVHSAMNIKEAYRLCPNGIYMHPNIEKYKAISHRLHEIWNSYATALEAIAFDEAYLDVTERAKDFDGARSIGLEIKRRIRDELKLSCSVGVAYSKTAAKIASEEKKPNGYFEILSPKDFVDLINDRDVRVLYTVGAMTAERLYANGIRTVRDISEHREEVVRLLGKQGRWITQLALGIDDRKVKPYRPEDAKSIGREITFQADVDDFDFITHVAYDQKPLTRRERAENVKKRDFLHKYSGVARQVIEALLEKYANDGITEIERTEVLRLDPFRRMGNPARIAKLFGGKEGYLKAVKELEEEIYRIG